MRTFPMESRQSPVRHWAIVALLLAFACSDGAATAIQITRGWVSPYPLMVPLLLAALLLMALDTQRIPVRLVVAGLALGLFATLTLLLQIANTPTVNIAGLAQFWLIFLCFFAAQEMVLDARAAQIETLRRGVRILHHGLVAYLVLITVVWYVFGIDISLFPLISGRQPVIVDYYGFRPSGVSREPAWAAFLLIATFIAVSIGSSKDRFPAFIALVLGAAILRSATALAFTALVVAVLTLDRGQMRRLPALLLASIPAAGALSLIFQERVARILTGADPSGQMRRDSATVAWDVIQQSFPLGTGYGNFRAVARYGSQFSNYVDLAAVTVYKSDIPVLNLLAEFGVGAAVIVGTLALLYARGGRILFWGYLAFILLLGSLLLPSNLVVMVAIGIAERERRIQPARAPVPDTPERRGLGAQRQAT